MKISVGKPDPNAQIPNLDAPRSAGTDQQDAQLAPDYYDVSTDLNSELPISGKLLLPCFTHLPLQEIAHLLLRFCCQYLWTGHRTLPCSAGHGCDGGKFTQQSYTTPVMERC
jgi:hypothetical protein